MSVKIGTVGEGLAPVSVYASTGGVEVENDVRLRLSPVEARNFAALLVRAADEVEHMRDRAVRRDDE